MDKEPAIALEKTDLEQFQAEPDPVKRAELFHSSEDLQKQFSAGNFPPKPNK